MSTTPLPQAYIHRSAGQLITTPRVPLPIFVHGKQAISIAIALWPLTGTLLCVIGLLAMAGRT